MNSSGSVTPVKNTASTVDKNMDLYLSLLSGSTLLYICLLYTSYGKIRRRGLIKNPPVRPGGHQPDRTHCQKTWHGQPCIQRVFPFFPGILCKQGFQSLKSDASLLAQGFLTLKPAKTCVSSHFSTKHKRISYLIPKPVNFRSHKQDAYANIKPQK